MPKNASPRILLTSVFGPYARDDEFGSRAINPMELYHNQVTRVQGAYSLRMFHRSWGLMLLQTNIEAPCVLLDFPSYERFLEELKRFPYDIVGISAIRPNVSKVREMCRLVRKHLPSAEIVVGGHIANDPDLSSTIDADHIVRGEGVRWLREHLGEDPSRPIRHPAITSGFGARTFGVQLGDSPASTAATLIPSVGCPMGCDFCSTSAMFGGRGKSVGFYKTGDELYDIMCRLEKATMSKAFFVMDENFLLYRTRAMRLLERMREGGKSWSLYVFSSANVLRLYSVEELVALGISWLWMGIEGKESSYKKLEGSDTVTLVRELQSNGIRVLGSTIIGLPEHTGGTIDAAIDYAVGHGTEFHQFMLYTPLPGTPLWAKHRAEGTLLTAEECPPEDTHGQLRFNFRHPSIQGGEETGMLLRAFDRDLEENGPSVVRVTRTMLKAYRLHWIHAEKRVRDRLLRDSAGLSTTRAAALWAAERHFRGSTKALLAMRELKREILREFPFRSRMAMALLGPFLLRSLKREEARLKRGFAYEPKTFYEANRPARALKDPRWKAARPSVSVCCDEGASSDPGGALAPGLAEAG